MPKAPTKKQLAYLKRRGYDGTAPKSSREATLLLTRLEGGGSVQDAEDALIDDRDDRESRRLQFAIEYLDGIESMDKDYRDAVGEPLVSGFRLKLPKHERTLENEDYHKAFLPLSVAFEHPRILAIEGIEYDELRRVPSHGQFVVEPRVIVHRDKGGKVPTARRSSGCATSLLVVAIAAGAFVACSFV